MNEIDFKRCPNGHYYQGDECPYCKSQNTIGDDNDCSMEVAFEDGPNLYSGLRSCPNRHAYDKRLSRCPYCGERDVYDRPADMCTGWLAGLLIQTNNIIELRIDGRLIIERTSVLRIEWLQHHSWRYGYSICGTLRFNYNSTIDINGILFRGKEFVEFIDFIADHKEFIENIKSIKDIKLL